ncbi:hypothetical protein M8C21_004204, partial [Ambrosia artemisiifolia]
SFSSQPSSSLSPPASSTAPALSSTIPSIRVPIVLSSTVDVVIVHAHFLYSAEDVAYSFVGKITGCSRVVAAFTYVGMAIPLEFVGSHWFYVICSICARKMMKRAGTQGKYECPDDDGEPKFQCETRCKVLRFVVSCVAVYYAGCCGFSLGLVDFHYAYGPH